MKKKKIKPCPFCGGRAEVETGNSMHCLECPAQLYWDCEIDEDDMVDAWNRRKHK